MSDWTLVLGIGGDGTFLVGKVGDLIEKVNQGADVKIRYQDDPATWWVRETSSAVVDANNRVTAVAEGLATSDLETIAYPYTPDQTRSCQRYDFFSSFGYMMSSDTFGKVDDWPMDPDPPRAVHMQWFARTGTSQEFISAPAQKPNPADAQAASPRACRARSIRRVQDDRTRHGGAPLTG